MRRALLCALVGSLVLLISCGGGDDGTDPTGGDQGDQAQEQDDDETAGTTINVQGDEYEFIGLPSEPLNAGETTFTFENAGTEPHEMVIFQLKTKKKLKELLALPQKEAQKFVQIVGGTGAGPGKTAKKPVTEDLQPGTYAMVCFVPVEKKGPPHFTRGMATEFKVQ